MTAPPSADEVAEIAKGLTGAMRSAILNASRSYAGDRDRVAATGMTRKALRDRGLGHGDWCYLTPLGLAVRNHLAAALRAQAALSPNKSEK